MSWTRSRRATYRSAAMTLAYMSQDRPALAAPDEASWMALGRAVRFCMGAPRRRGDETCRWQMNVETSWRHGNREDDQTKWAIAQSQWRDDGLSGCGVSHKTRQSSELAERFAQLTDRVKNEVTGESVHVDERAMGLCLARVIVASIWCFRSRLCEVGEG